MNNGESEDEYLFLDRPEDETADEFLKRRLSHMESHFSYENLTGLSEEGLNGEIGYYNDLINDLYSHFANKEFTFAEHLDSYEALIGEEVDIYEPLSQEQSKQITETTRKVKRNFDKAHEDFRDTRIERIGYFLSSVPGLRRLRLKP